MSSLPLPTRFRPTRAILAASLALVATTPAGAQQGTAMTPTIEQLQRQLAERDALIADLVRRVEALERGDASGRAASKAQIEGPPVPEPRPMPAPAMPVARQPPSVPPSPPPPEGPPTRQAAASRPGEVQVDEEAAERALERALVQGGAILLRPGQAEITPSVRYTRSEEDAAVLVAGGTSPVGDQEIRRDRLESALGLRVGLPLEAQFELELPYTYVDQSSVLRTGFAVAGEEDRHGSGPGDLRVGVARALLRERGWLPDLVGRLTWDTATGEKEDGGVALGYGFDEVEARLTASKRLDPLVFVADLSYERPFEDDDIRLGNRLGLSLGALLATGPETTLSLVLSQTFIDETEVGGREVRGSDLVVGSLGLGVSVVLGAGTLLDVSGSIGLTEEAADYAVRVALPIRFNLPPL
jgi:hypothetical protein